MFGISFLELKARSICKIECIYIFSILFSEEFTRYHCRSQALGLTPLSDMSDVCLRYICPIAGAVLNESLKCDCDVTGSVSSICAPKGGQCECKPNVVGRR